MRGDVTLKKTTDDFEYLGYNERQTKTWTEYPNVFYVRPFAPKMFATDGSEKDPVAMYKLFPEKRPDSMKEAESLCIIVLFAVSVTLQNATAFLRNAFHLLR